METPLNKLKGKAFLFGLALLGLLGNPFKTSAQCPQLAGQTTYSRVINGPFNTNTFVQADYDYTNNNVYVASTNTSVSSDPWLGEIQNTSPITWSYRYPFTGNEIITSVKKCANGDEVFAGTTVNASGNHEVFVERVSSTGGFIWARYYAQSTTDVTYRVLVTETSVNNDIVVAASSWSAANDLILIRIASNGTMLYYDDHAIFAAANLAERYPQFNAIAATNDDGFVVVGNTGHNWDFFAATVVKYDVNYNISGTHAVGWWYVYRHPLVTYNLWNAGQRSSTFAHGVVINPNNQNVVVVGRTGDNDQYGTSTTYQNGFILVLNSSGVLQSLNNYVPSNGDFIDFNAVNMSGSDYIISGSAQDPNTMNYQTLVTLVSSSTLNTSWSYLYGTNSLNIGYSVFTTPNGYLSVGISNDNSTPDQPHLLAVDNNGQVGSCYTAVDLVNNAEKNDLPKLKFGQASSAQPVSVQTNTVTDCEAMYHLCGPLCPQLSPKTHYSRVINDAFNTTNWLQADYDHTNDNTLVPSTYIGGTSPALFWSNVALNSTINFSEYYPVTGNEKGLAIKNCANGDVLIAGNTTGSSGNHVLFVMRTTSSGTPLWYKYFDQNTTDVDANVVLTETEVSNDVVLASWTTSSNDDLVFIRLTSSGTMRYYDDHPVFAAGNLGERYPTINGITATADDGYVAVGNTGHNWDFFAATVMKFDANYYPGMTHANNWNYVYRHDISTSYDLWTVGHRSSTYAHGVIEDASGNIIVVGYQADNDQYGTNATYQYGFCMQLSSAGAYINRKLYVNGNQTFMSLNGLTIDGSGDYVCTGSLRDPSTNVYQTLIMKIASSNLNPSWAKLYGTGTVNMGYSIFTTPNGFVSVGISNDNTANTQPHLLSVDANGDAGQCYTNLQTDFVLDNNDIPTFSIGSSTGAQAVAPQVRKIDICEEMYDLCASATAPVRTGTGKQTLAAGEVKMYPNPAADLLNIDLSAKDASKGTITVKDMLGHDIMTMNVEIAGGANHFELNIAAVKPGIYFVQVVNDRNAVSGVTRIQKY